MNATLRLRSVVIALVAVFALAALPSPANANHSWGGYHWARTRNPFTIKLGDNLSSSWKTYLQTTSTDWSKSSVLDTTIVTGQSNNNCRATRGRVEVCNRTYGNNGWLGLASISISGSHITQGTVKLNDTYFAQAKYNNSSEKEHVVCQEVGHTFGLDHQDESGISLNTCMDYYHNTSSSDTKSIHPNQHDYDQLASIYAHLDSSTTISSVPAAMAQSDFSTPEQWGKRIETSRDGRAATYMRDFGGGHKQITFVYWAK